MNKSRYGKTGWKISLWDKGRRFWNQSFREVFRQKARNPSLPDRPPFWKVRSISEQLFQNSCIQIPDAHRISLPCCCIKFCVRDHHTFANGRAQHNPIPEVHYFKTSLPIMKVWMSEIEFALSSAGRMWKEDSSTLPEQDEDWGGWDSPAPAGK